MRTDNQIVFIVTDALSAMQKMAAAPLADLMRIAERLEMAVHQSRRSGGS
jgi:hypothetical protein